MIRSMRIDAAWGGVNNPRWRSLGQRGASPYAGGLAAACRRRAVVAKLLHGAVACLLLEATFRAVLKTTADLTSGDLRTGREPPEVSTVVAAPSASWQRSRQSTAVRAVPLCNTQRHRTREINSATYRRKASAPE